MALVDTNVLIDIWSHDPVWEERSGARYAECLANGGVAVNPVICAELSLGFPSASALDEALAVAQLVQLDLPCEAAFLAGRAFQEYRRRGGTKPSTLPDFFIGAHAVVARLPLLTRDPAGYQSYFPEIQLILP